MATYEVYDTQGNLLHSEEIADPLPDAHAIIAAIDVMTNEQKAALRSALGL